MLPPLQFPEPAIAPWRDTGGLPHLPAPSKPSFPILQHRATAISSLFCISGGQAGHQLQRPPLLPFCSPALHSCPTHISQNCMAQIRGTPVQKKHRTQPRLSHHPPQSFQTDAASTLAPPAAQWSGWAKKPLLLGPLQAFSPPWQQLFWKVFCPCWKFMAAGVPALRHRLPSEKSFGSSNRNLELHSEQGQQI